MQYLEAPLLPLIGLLDRIRSTVLRISFRSHSLRLIYADFTIRLGLLFGLACVGALATALFFPVWVLALGPMIYGVPHLIASFRYTARPLVQKNASVFSVLAVLFVTIAGLRTLYELGVFHSPLLSSSSLGLEMAGWVVTVAVFFRYMGFSVRSFLSLCLAGGGVVLAIRRPVETLATLTLIHNWVAFFYWIRVAQTPARRRLAILCSTIFTVLSALLFWGAFDSLYFLWKPTANLEWAQLDYGMLGALIAPLAESHRVLFHATVVYAFGQTLHYFVWLKAIPDEMRGTVVPKTYRSDFARWKMDTGRFALSIPVLGGALLVGAMGVWLFQGYTQARTLYFALAAYHGFLELGGLFATRPEDARKWPVKHLYV